MHYGQALRELESGLRRDDLWAQAFVKSGGDENKTKAIYLNLVATRLAHEASAPIQLDRVQTTAATVAKSGKIFFRWIFMLLVCAVVAAIFAVVASKIYEDKLAAEDRIVVEEALRNSLKNSFPHENIEMMKKELEKATYTSLMSDYDYATAITLTRIKIDASDMNMRLSSSSFSKVSNARGLCFIISLFFLIFALIVMRKKKLNYNQSRLVVLRRQRHARHRLPEKLVLKAM